MTDEEEIISALAEVLQDTSAAMTGGGGWPREIAEHYAAALLPVVRRVAEQRAAEELAVLASRLVAQDVEDMAVYDEIGALRAALTATPNHGRNAT